MKQTWACPEEKCDRTYVAPIRILGITCTNALRHPKGGQREMVLIAGDPIVRKTKKKVNS